MTLPQWIDDLAQRIQKLEIGMRDGFSSVWLGGLALPSGWITATRQAASHQLQTSLEKLHLSLQLDEIEGDASIERATFAVQGKSSW